MKIELHPPHHSMRGRGVRPRGMDKMPMTAEHLEAVEHICLGILADMTNGQRGLLETLVAIYLSGAQHAISVMQEPKP
jgi:hypothetical protein